MTKQATQHTAHFQISGADFTRIARERLLEDNPGHAWRIASCLGNDDGDDREAGVSDAALAILKGAKKLVGNESSMKLVKEHAKVTEKYLAQVQYIYAGRIKVFDKWYRPVAYVSDMGPRDMKNDHGKHVGYVFTQRGYTNRAWHYCGKDEIVIDNATHADPEFPSIKREVIFRACGERPFWQTPPLTPQAAVDEFLAADHQLEERSHSKWYGTTADAIWDGVPDPEPGDPADNTIAVRALHQRAARTKHERDVIKRGDLTPLNARLNAEEQLAQELAEDDRLLAEKWIEKQREELRLQHLADLRTRILKQAGDDLLDLTWPATLLDEKDEAWGKGKEGDVKHPAGSVKVPRAPFMHWAFARMKMFNDQLPPWQTICPSGMKMQLDDANHTDWIVGAGFDPQNRDLLYHPGPVADAAMQLSHVLQNQFDQPSDVHVLVDGPHVSGQVFHGKRNQPSPAGSIVVLPDLRPAYLEAIADAAGVITEEGGAVAHLAQIGRERNLPIVRVANAREKYEPGIYVMIDTASRKVEGL
jgi:phosphohistidine swiveling domain-containing protein